jgi:hypothetical protein
MSAAPAVEPSGFGPSGDFTSDVDTTSSPPGPFDPTTPWREEELYPCPKCGRKTVRGRIAVKGGGQGSELLLDPLSATYHAVRDREGQPLLAKAKRVLVVHSLVCKGRP